MQVCYKKDPNMKSAQNGYYGFCNIFKAQAEIFNQVYLPCRKVMISIIHAYPCNVFFLGVLFSGRTLSRMYSHGPLI